MRRAKTHLAGAQFGFGRYGEVCGGWEKNSAFGALVPTGELSVQKIGGRGPATPVRRCERFTESFAQQ